MLTEKDPTNLLGLPVQALSPQVKSADHTSDKTPLQLDINSEAAARTLAAPEPGVIKLALIDSYRLSQECLIAGFERMRPKLLIMSFNSVEDFLSKRDGSIDLILYVPHDGAAAGTAVLENLGAIRQATNDIPVVVLSDSESGDPVAKIRMFLNGGARGFVPAQTTGVGMAHAAIRLVHAGGTFAPLNELLTTSSIRKQAAPESTQSDQLTSRQADVLEHLRRGKANKIIAYELKMSESTVKVHVRNIMRKLNASNRTQIAYKAQLLGLSA